MILNLFLLFSPISYIKKRAVAPLIDALIKENIATIPPTTL